jgi:hypothetical protein
MRKPLHGDQLTIRYDGAIVRARCDDITENPIRGVGAANFTIVSGARFERGHEAMLLEGPNETAIQVVRVTAVGHHRANKVNIVLFSAIFDSASKADSALSARASV